MTTTLTVIQNITGSIEYQKNGFLFISQFLDSDKISSLERQIMTLFKADNFIELSNKMCSLNEKNQERLFEFNKVIGKNPIITSSCARLLEFIDYDPRELCAIHLGGGVLLGLPNDNRLTYTWHQESNYIPG